MDTGTIASVDLSWDEFGKISHDLRLYIPANDYQKSDALALSAALAVPSQLGVLTPTTSLALCDGLLAFLEQSQHQPEPILYPLASARIDLMQKESTIVCTFHPSFLEGGTMEPEEAIRRLLTNYLHHVSSSVIPELAGYLRSVLVLTTSYYLTVALATELNRPGFAINSPSPQIAASMIEFSHSIFPQWRGGPSMPPARFATHLSEARDAHISLLRRLA